MIKYVKKLNNKHPKINIYIMGDFNAWHIHWNCHENNFF